MIVFAVITCPDIDEVPSAAKMDTSFSTYMLSSQVNFSCDTGYHIRGNPTLTCVDQNLDGVGEWDVPPPECDRELLTSATEMFL